MVNEKIVKCTCNSFTDCVNVKKKCQLSDHVLRMSENTKIYTPLLTLSKHTVLLSVDTSQKQL